MTSKPLNEGSMYIVFGSYLKQLEADEGQKPLAQRRNVPTIKDLAEVAGVHQVTLTNIVNGKIDRLTIEVARKVLDHMWRLGFQPKETDFIRYVPPEE